MKRSLTLFLQESVGAGAIEPYPRMYKNGFRKTKSSSSWYQIQNFLSNEVLRTWMDFEKQKKQRQSFLEF